MESVNNLKLTRKEKFQQIDRADSINKINKKDLKSAVNSVQKFSGDVGKTSEQELFTAIVYDGLGKIDQKIQAKFIEKLPELIEKVASFDADNAVLRGTRRALRQLVQENSLAKGAGKILRQFALGKSQLDTDRTRLSSEQSASSFDQIFKKVSANKIASEAELIKFNHNNRAEFSREIKDTTIKEVNPTEKVDEFKAEFELRKKVAQSVVDVIENDDPTLSSLDRMNKVVNFYVSETVSKDASVHKRAELILDAINNTGSDVELAKEAYRMMSEYMKSVFEIDVTPL
jgi:hypothetical protein